MVDDGDATYTWRSMWLLDKRLQALKIFTEPENVLQVRGCIQSGFAQFRPYF